MQICWVRGHLAGGGRCQAVLLLPVAYWRVLDQPDVRPFTPIRLVVMVRCAGGGIISAVGTAQATWCETDRLMYNRSDIAATNRTGRTWCDDW
jgi:hypothetical protein